MQKDQITTEFLQNFKAAPDELAGRVILVSGAGDGIGRAAALCFAAHGATVALLGRTIKKLEAVYDDIEAAGYAKPAIIPLNLEGAAAKDYDDLANAIQTEFGRLDGLLHNAAILGNRTPLESYPLELWEKVLQVNTTAPFMMTQALLPLLRQSEDAAMLVTSSSVGRKSKAHWGAYAVSKFALEGFMQTLADEIDDGSDQMRINSLNPGATRTPMRRTAYPAENPANNKSPDELMSAYLYLLGPASRGVNGGTFNAQ